MKHKYSKSFLFDTINFMKSLKTELGEQLGEDKFHQVMDTIDPSIRKQLLYHMITNDTISGSFRIKRDWSVKNPQTIMAIKTIRSYTGFSLKDSKDLIDTANAGKIATTTPTFHTMNAESLDQFRKELDGTGYVCL